MAAGVGQKIESGDYSTIKQKVDLVLGAGSGQSGYGQTITSPSVVTGNTISAAEYIALRADIAKAYTHQTGGTLGTSLETSSYSGSNLINVVSGVTTISESIRGQFNYMADSITTNKFSVGANQLADSTLVSGTSSQPWNNILTQTVTVTFGSNSAARYFFNAGGKIRASASTSGGTATAKDTSWTILLSGLGEVAIDYSTFYSLGTVDTQIVKTYSTGAYANNYYKLSARVDNATTPSVLTLTVNFADDAVGPPDDNVDATVTSTIKASTPTGAFSLSAPSATQSGFAGGAVVSSNYSITPDKTSMNEGDTVTFTVTGTNIPNGTILYWILSPSSTFPKTAQRFSDSQNSGTVTINNNTGTLTRTVFANATTDGSSSFSVEIHSVSASGTLLATSSQITVNDTSLSAPTTYTVTISTPSGAYQSGFTVTAVLNNPAVTSTTVTVPFTSTINGISAGNYTFTFAQGVATQIATQSGASATGAGRITITPGTSSGLTTATSPLTFDMSSAASITLSGYAPIAYLLPADNNARVTATTMTQKGTNGSVVTWTFNSTGGAVTVSSIVFPTGVIVNGYALGTGNLITAATVPSFQVSGLTDLSVSINLASGNSASGNITVSFSGATSPSSPQTTAMTITRVPTTATISFSPNTSGAYKDSTKAIVQGTLDVPASAVSGAITVSVPYTGTGSLASVTGSPITLTFPTTGATQTQSSAAISTAGARGTTQGTIVIGTPTSTQVPTVSVSPGLGTYTMASQAAVTVDSISITTVLGNNGAFAGETNIAVNWTSTNASYVKVSVNGVQSATQWPAQNATGTGYTITAPTSGTSTTVALRGYLTDGSGESPPAVTAMNIFPPSVSSPTLTPASGTVTSGKSISVYWEANYPGTTRSITTTAPGATPLTGTGTGGSITGTFSFTPTTVGSGSFTITIINPYGVSATSPSMAYTVSAALAPLTLSPTNITATITVDTPYLEIFTASGGTPPYSYSPSQTITPVGVTGPLSSGGSNQFSYTPTQTGTVSYGIYVTDASSPPLTLNQKITYTNVVGKPTISVTGPTVGADNLVSFTINTAGTGVYQGFIILGDTYNSLISWTFGTAPYSQGLSVPSNTGTITSGSQARVDFFGANSGTFTGKVLSGNPATTVSLSVSRTGYTSFNSSAVTVPANTIVAKTPTWVWTLGPSATAVAGNSITTKWGYEVGTTIANLPPGAIVSGTGTFSGDTLGVSNGSTSFSFTANANGQIVGGSSATFFTGGQAGRRITWSGHINSISSVAGYSVTAIPADISAKAFFKANPGTISVSPSGTVGVGDVLTITVTGVTDALTLSIDRISGGVNRGLGSTGYGQNGLDMTGSGTYTTTYTTASGDTNGLSFSATASLWYDRPYEGTITSNTVNVTVQNIDYQFFTSNPWGTDGPGIDVLPLGSFVGTANGGPFYRAQPINFSIKGAPNTNVVISSPQDTRYGSGKTISLSTQTTGIYAGSAISFDLIGSQTGGYLGVCSADGFYQYTATFTNGKVLTLSYTVAIPALTIDSVGLQDNTQIFKAPFSGKPNSFSSQLTPNATNAITFHTSTIKVATNGTQPGVTALTSISAVLNGYPDVLFSQYSIQNTYLGRPKTGIPDNNHYFLMTTDGSMPYGQQYTGTITVTDSYGQTGTGYFYFSLPAAPVLPKPTFSQYSIGGNYSNVGDNFVLYLNITNASINATTVVIPANTVSLDGTFGPGYQAVYGTLLPAALGNHIKIQVTASGSGGSSVFEFNLPGNAESTVVTSNYPQTVYVSPSTFSASTGTLIRVSGIPGETFIFAIAAPYTVPVYQPAYTLNIDGTGFVGPPPQSGYTTWEKPNAFQGATAGTYYLWIKWPSTGKETSALMVVTADIPTITFDQYQTIDTAYSYVVEFTVTISGYPSGVTLDYGAKYGHGPGLDFASPGGTIAGVDGRQLSSLQNGTHTIQARTNLQLGYGNFTMAIGDKPLYLNVRQDQATGNGY